MQKEEYRKLIIIGIATLLAGILLAGTIITLMTIHENNRRNRLLREREITEVLVTYLTLNYCKDTETLANALNRLEANIINSQTLSSIQEGELLSRITYAVSLLGMDAHWDLQNRTREIVDTRRSIINIGGIQYHLGLLPEQTLQIVLWRRNPENLEDMERIQEYLDGGDFDFKDTPRGQFQTSIIDRIPDGNSVYSQPMSAIAEIIESLLEER